MEEEVIVPEAHVDEEVVVDAPVAEEVVGAEVKLDEQVVPDTITSPELVPEEIVGKVEEIGLGLNHVSLGDAGDTDSGLVIS